MVISFFSFSVSLNWCFAAIIILQRYQIQPARWLDLKSAILATNWLNFKPDVDCHSIEFYTRGVDQIYRLGLSFQKGYSTQHKLLQGSISRIWNGWTPDKIYPISWKQWKRRKREGNLWKSEKRSVVMEIRWAEWPRRKVCRTMKNLGYCFDSLSTRPPPLPSLLATITISIFTRGLLLQTELRISCISLLFLSSQIVIWN